MLKRLITKLMTPAPAAAPQGPPCDDCPNMTGKPHLYYAPRTRWLCDDCDARMWQLLVEINSLRLDPFDL
ncbi:hypothetical protein [Streptomyces tendae]|uniref:hypothetical protein n=1 Tax=Streptomyces tendae TaxID=1932 RepID=UPI003EB877CE